MAESDADDRGATVDKCADGSQPGSQTVQAFQVDIDAKKTKSSKKEKRTKTIKPKRTASKKNIHHAIPSPVEDDMISDIGHDLDDVTTTIDDDPDDPESADLGQDIEQGCQDVGQEKRKTFDIMLLPSTRSRIAQEVDKAQRRMEQLSRLAKTRKPVIRFEPKIAEAPVSTAEMNDMGEDMLDFLGKFCIIQEERIKIYEDVFLAAAEEDEDENTDVEPSLSANAISKGRQLSEIERQDSKLGQQVSNLGNDPPTFGAQPIIFSGHDPISAGNDPNSTRDRNNSSHLREITRDSFMTSDTPLNTDRDDVTTPVTPVPNLASRRKTLKISPDMYLTEEEFLKCQDISVLTQVRGLSNSTMSAGREYLERLSCSLDLMLQREEQLKTNREFLQRQKLGMIVDTALCEFPADYAKFHPVRYQELLQIQNSYAQKQQQQQIDENPDVIHIPLRNPPLINLKDEGVYKLLGERPLEQICENSANVRSLDLQIERVDEKLATVEIRLEQIFSERTLVRTYCDLSDKDDVTSGSEKRKRSSTRVRSAMSCKLHPNVDRRIAVDDLLPSLKQINRNLITDNELAYISHVLDLPGRRPLNFHLFSVIAALSEKVVNSESYMRALIDKIDCEGLVSKIDTCKNLFLMITNGDCIPEGTASSFALGLDLLAGGVEENHIRRVVRKLTRIPGVIDFLDFVTYIPLFIEVHQHIVHDPLTPSYGR